MNIEGGDEFILDASDAVTGEGEFMTPQDPEGDEPMAIDEEGRPRFAPAKDIVCAAVRCDERKLT